MFIRKNILFLVLMSIIISAVGCKSFDHVGRSVEKTPYDGGYQSVIEYLDAIPAGKTIPSDEYKTIIGYLKKAGKFEYRAEPPGQCDNWQLPSETEKLDSGDCEDKAIWLYSKLRERGFNVRLVIGNLDVRKVIIHAWVNWYYGDVYILDPTIKYRRYNINCIQNAEWYSKGGYYQPFYSYDGIKKWRHGS